jgi:hypothetical protein
MVIAPIVMAALNGVSMSVGLEIAGLQAGVLAVSVLFALALGRSSML